MIISDFWNQAFISALARLPANEAKREANIATEMCIEHWHKKRASYAPALTALWQNQDIALVPNDVRKYPISSTDDPLDD
jgi:hypothetical protein